MLSQVIRIPALARGIVKPSCSQAGARQEPSQTTADDTEVRSRWSSPTGTITKRTQYSHTQPCDFCLQSQEVAEHLDDLHLDDEEAAGVDEEVDNDDQPSFSAAESVSDDEGNGDNVEDDVVDEQDIPEEVDGDEDM